MYQDSHLGVPEGGEREKGSEKIFEVLIAEIFPNMGKETGNQVCTRDAQSLKQDINPRRNIPRHMVIKLTKVKDKLLKQQGKHDK